jgi:hypothetical protein
MGVSLTLFYVVYNVGLPEKMGENKLSLVAGGHKTGFPRSWYREAWVELARRVYQGRVAPKVIWGVGDTFGIYVGGGWC